MVAATAVGSGGSGAMVDAFFDDITRVQSKEKNTQRGSKSGTRSKTDLIFRGSFGCFLSNKDPPNPITIRKLIISSF